ncbi:hypothetical protein ACIP9H_10045 [Streptomyces sp. NPDC088732]|uniref:hypothetical protein n=1 Tax=Streptomyces sp. NPDC088732 TaxID=3365879 RepID=UPI003818A606
MAETRGCHPIGGIVAEGRATAPAASGPVPLPLALGDPEIDTAAALVSMRDEERW